MKQAYPDLKLRDFLEPIMNYLYLWHAMNSPEAKEISRLKPMTIGVSIPLDNHFLHLTGVSLCFTPAGEQPVMLETKFEDQMVLGYNAYTLITGEIRYGKNHCGN